MGGYSSDIESRESFVIPDYAALPVLQAKNRFVLAHHLELQINSCKFSLSIKNAFLDVRACTSFFIIILPCSITDLLCLFAFYVILT